MDGNSEKNDNAIKNLPEKDLPSSKRKKLGLNNDFEPIHKDNINGN